MRETIERCYAAARRAGFLRAARWQPGDGRPDEHAFVHFTAPSETVLEGLGLTTDTAITYPSSAFVGLTSRDTVWVDDVRYTVRHVRAIGDGWELRAALTPA